MAVVTRLRAPEERAQCKAMAVTAVIVLLLFLAIFTMLLGVFGFFSVLIMVGTSIAGLICFEYSGWFDRTPKQPR